MTKHVLISLALLLSMLSGCSRQIVPPIAPPSAASPAARADRAWQAMQYDTARSLYRDLLQRPGLSPDRRSLYGSRAVAAGLALNDLEGADRDLQTWAENMPSALDTLEWQRLHLRRISRTAPAPERVQAVQNTLARPGLPWTDKLTLGEERVNALRRDGFPREALQVIAALHEAAPDRDARRELEHGTLTLATSMPPEERETILTDVVGPDRELFPFSLIAWAQGQDLLSRSPDEWPSAYRLLAPAARSEDLADREWFRSELAGLEQRFGAVASGIVLLIPMSGPYQSIGREIARGAQCALFELPERTFAAQELRIINSAGPDWQNELAELPPRFKVVGGPLRRDIWQTVRKHGLHRERFFLSFMSSLPDEGRAGWRFFGSPADQVRTVVRAAMDMHGIRSFAVFYPEERFGSTMAREFWKGVRAEGGVLSGMGTYDPGSPRRLGEAVAGLLDAPAEDSEEEAPEPDFQAVFLPDSLSRAELLAPQFFFYDAKNLLFLGPQVWNQAFLGHADPELQYLSRSLFPGAWWPDNPVPEMVRLQQAFIRQGWGSPGFWAGLGHDFISFGSRLENVSPLDGPERTASILHGAAERMPGWTIAPLDWDAQGHARQNMFLFRPGHDGPVRIPQAGSTNPESYSPGPAGPETGPEITETNIPS